MTYLTPTYTEPLPDGLTLTQFIQTVLVGLTNIDGTLVRPEWQPAPPKQPDINVNWLAFGVANLTPDAYSYVATGDTPTNIYSQRQETFEVTLSIYGLHALETYGLLRDGFQIPQNLQALFSANIGFTEITGAFRVPELVNERFINRVTTSIFFRREIQRLYGGALTLTSASGTIHTFFGDEPYLLNWGTSL